MCSSLSEDDVPVMLNDLRGGGLEVLDCCKIHSDKQAFVNTGMVCS